MIPTWKALASGGKALDLQIAGTDWGNRFRRFSGLLLAEITSILCVPARFTQLRSFKRSRQSQVFFWERLTRRKERDYRRMFQMMKRRVGAFSRVLSRIREILSCTEPSKTVLLCTFVSKPHVPHPV